MSYDSTVHSSFSDVTSDNGSRPTSVAIHIKSSKTYPFRKGVTIHLGRTETNLCPVAALTDYTNNRGNHHGPLFCFKTNKPCNRTSFVAKLREALGNTPSIKPEDFCGHSIRIGAATTVAKRGIPDNIIKMLGRWESSAYQLYIYIPCSELSKISKQSVANDLYINP